MAALRQGGGGKRKKKEKAKLEKKRVKKKKRRTQFFSFFFYYFLSFLFSLGGKSCEKKRNTKKDTEGMLESTLLGNRNGN